MAVAIIHIHEDRYVPELSRNITSIGSEEAPMYLIEFAQLRDMRGPPLVIMIIQWSLAQHRSSSNFLGCTLRNGILVHSTIIDSFYRMRRCNWLFWIRVDANVRKINIGIV